MKELITSHLCKNLDLALSGSLFGGRLLEWLAESGSIHAMKSTGVSGHMVLYRLDDLRIVRPVRAGEIVNFHAVDTAERTSSVSFGIVAETGGETVLHCECTYVCVDAAGRKMPLRQAREAHSPSPASPARR